MKRKRAITGIQKKEEAEHSLAGSYSSLSEPTVMAKSTPSRIEVTVCDEKDLNNGDMKEIEIEGSKVLVVKDENKLFAIGGKCSHYGAPLVNGVYSNGMVRCPWHGACFNIKTGDIEDFPGLDGVAKFDVKVSGGKVKVHADKEKLSKQKVTKSMCAPCPNDKRTVLIIGGGPASVTCCETLRQEGFQGRITVATMEKCIPYDRPKLSKAMDLKPDAIALRSQDFYKKYGIDIHLEKEAVKVNTKEKSVTFKDGGRQKYDFLMIATGGKPRLLPIPGMDLKNIFSLRTLDDANTIADSAKAKNVVIIGSSFIGMEVASYLADKAKSVTVADMIKVPFQLTLGEEVGSVLQKLHEEKGVKFHFNNGIKEFSGKGGIVTEAVLSDGTRLPADVVILGVGVVPATDFLKESGIEMTKRGFIPVNKCMQTNDCSVFAAGDIVEFPLFTQGDSSVNIQHFQMAHMHGKIAALNILGKNKEIRSVPYFWTVQYGKSIRYTGYGPGYDGVIVHGEPENLKFVAYYTKGEDVVAAASLAFDPIVSQVAEMMNSGKVIKKSEVLQEPRGWLSRLCEAASAL